MAGETHRHILCDIYILTLGTSTDYTLVYYMSVAAAEIEVLFQENKSILQQ